MCHREYPGWKHHKPATAAALPSNEELCRGWSDQLSASPGLSPRPSNASTVTVQEEGTVDPLWPQSPQLHSLWAPAVWQTVQEHPDPKQQVQRQPLPASHQVTELLTYSPHAHTHTHTTHTECLQTLVRMMTAMMGLPDLDTRAGSLLNCDVLWLEIYCSLTSAFLIHFPLRKVSLQFFLFCFVLRVCVFVCVCRLEMMSAARLLAYVYMVMLECVCMAIYYVCLCPLFFAQQY